MGSEISDSEGERHIREIPAIGLTRRELDEEPIIHSCFNGRCDSAEEVAVIKRSLLQLRGNLA